MAGPLRSSRCFILRSPLPQLDYRNLEIFSVSRAMIAHMTWSASSALPMRRQRGRCGFPVRRCLAPFQHNEARALVSIELKHLRYAEVAERCGSFRKAADLLALKQSNLSRRVRYLEEQLGVALFERTNAGVKPTAAGRNFVNGVRRILTELQIVVDGAKAVGRGEAGYLTIGFYTSLSAGNLRSTLLDYARRFPQVHISAVEEERSRLCTGLRSGTIDIAVVTGEPAAQGGSSMALWSERILIALPETHRLAAKDVLTWADLKRERFVVSTRDPGPEIEAILIAKLVTPGESLDKP